ncbi:MAG TPA: photosynthetic reaction center cytochrome c subunit family protein [Bryobacteraceae bacterium]|nr:photosynthetic reaction center cytochrome c subunit family protein [Bryobacteraceae bacterium]
MRARLAIVYLMGATILLSQPEKPLLAEQVFKNVKVLKGIPVGEFMDTMGFFAASLGLNCVYCHVEESMENWDKFAEDVPRKETARAMILMVNAINKGNFGGRRALTCYSCHRGAEHPKVVPSLADQYTVPTEDPNEIEIVKDAPQGPSADQILDRYIQALGGSERLAGVTSFAGKGTYEGYDTYHEKVPLEIYAQAPGQRSIIAHTQNGDSTTTFDGRTGWTAAVDKPVHLLPLLPGSELDGAKLDANLCFPAGIKQALGQWRNGFPVTAIEDREVQLVQGTAAGGSRVKLYFDSRTGLLARQMRYTNTIVGTIPIQIDYSDYREIGGIKMPFHWVVTWTGGQSTMQLNEVQANVAIDAAKFSKPAPAVVTKAVVR